MEFKDKENEQLEKDELTKLFSERVKELRKSRGYTQEQLAEKSNLNRGYIGHIEQRKKCTNIFTAKKIAEALGITLSELLKNL